MVATKKVVEAVESTSVELAEPVTPESIDAMKAQQKELAARIKAMKAALPKKSSLESVLEKQSNGVTDKRSRQYFAGLVRSRIKAGQDRETALSAVVEMFTDFLMAEIAKE